MKILNKILTVLLIMMIFVSCDNRDKQSNAEVKEADVRTVQLDIKGMTCEIGCAKLIQSKLYKTNGVTFAEVHFADSSGVVSYDANRLTEKELIEVVEKAGGGDLYRVNSVNAVANETSIEESPESAD